MSKIHATAIVEDGASLAEDVEIGPFSLIGRHAVLGEGVRILSHVVVAGHTKIGARTIVHPHAVLGGGPQFRGDPGTDARLTIGEDNVIREHVTMNGGSAKGGGLTEVGDRG
jgi:UDP-N-acetylglucosamine acyltransferase